jgi:hypothetical protein
MQNLEERMEREIELVEQDDSLTPQQKEKEINNIISEYKDMRREEDCKNMDNYF